MVRSDKERCCVGALGQRNRLLRRCDDGRVTAQTRALQRLGTEQRRQRKIGRGRRVGPPPREGIEPALILTRRDQGMRQE